MYCKLKIGKCQYEMKFLIKVFKKVFLIYEEFGVLENSSLKDGIKEHKSVEVRWGVYLEIAKVMMLIHVRRLLDSYLNDKQSVMKDAIILITRIWRNGGRRNGSIYRQTAYF